MNILEQIVARKKEEIQAARERVSVRELSYYRHYQAPVASLRQSLTTNKDFPVIAEFKRKSPSKGDIHPDADVKKIIPGYVSAGVSGISVLTDKDFFGGHHDDLSMARDLTPTPIIRKEFIIDPYQVYEAKAIGASVILLIASILSKKQALELATLADYLGMEVLMELHTPNEMDKLNVYVDMVGVNNRNLKTFDVDIENAVKMASSLPGGMLPVAESGIHSPQDIRQLQEAGFQGFLMGEYFMKQEDPARACLELKKNSCTKKPKPDE